MGWVVIMGECPLGVRFHVRMLVMSDPGSGGVLGGRLRAGLMESMTLYLVVIIGVLIVGYWSLEIVIEIELWVGGDGICWVCYFGVT